jgi:hypothetical protein
MTTHLDPYNAAGITAAQSQQVKQALAKARKSIHSLAEHHASDEHAFKKELASTHDKTMKELEGILGDAKAKELVGHFVKAAESQSTAA